MQKMDNKMKSINLDNALHYHRGKFPPEIIQYQRIIPALTATRFTKLLVEKGILTTKEEAAGRKSALYSFDMLMDLVRV